MVRSILIILLIWALWLGYQYQTKTQTASSLVQKRIEEFFATDPKLILQETGKGRIYKTVEVNGKKFWISWEFEKKGEKEVVMKGRVDFVELLPFTDLRLGHIFSPTLQSE